MWASLLWRLLRGQLCDLRLDMNLPYKQRIRMCLYLFHCMMYIMHCHRHSFPQERMLLVISYRNHPGFQYSLPSVVNSIHNLHLLEFTLETHYVIPVQNHMLLVSSRCRRSWIRRHNRRFWRCLHHSYRRVVRSSEVSGQLQQLPLQLNP